MTHEICDSCETVAHCIQHGCIPIQQHNPCREALQLEVDILQRRLMQSERRIAVLEQENLQLSWQTNPDRMGGSFSQDEIDNTGWR